jgi:hypothetical protein
MDETSPKMAPWMLLVEVIGIETGMVSFNKRPEN